MNWDSKKLKNTKNVMVNPKSVILNLVQNLIRGGLIQHLNQGTDPETSSG
jgi:hypothetical protein